MKRLISPLILILSLIHCGGQTMTNPSSTIRELGRPSSVHIQAMTLLDVQVGIENKNYQEILQRMLWVPGYTNEARMEALNRLWAYDSVSTTRIIRQQLPRLNNWNWLTTLCQWIADEKIEELDEALISSWASPSIMVMTEEERPEYKAIVAMFGADEVVEVIFTSLVQSNKSWKQG